MLTDDPSWEQWIVYVKYVSLRSTSAVLQSDL